MVVRTPSPTHRSQIYSSKIETRFLSWCSWILPFTFGVRCRYRRHKVTAQQPPSNQPPEPTHQSKSHFLSCWLFPSWNGFLFTEFTCRSGASSSYKSTLTPIQPQTHTKIHQGKSLYARKWAYTLLIEILLVWLKIRGALPFSSAQVTDSASILFPNPCMFCTDSSLLLLLFLSLLFHPNRDFP